MLTAEREEAAEEAAVLDEAADAAAEAFDEADFGFEGELSFSAFIEALDDPIVCQKVADATRIPLKVINGMSYDQLEGFFDQIDTDMSGTVSFTEWVSALVQLRKQMLEQEKA